MDLEAFVYPRMPLEVLRDRRVRDILDIEPRQPVLVQLKFSAVGREQQRPSRSQEPCRVPDESGMIPLDIEIALHGFGSRIGGRIKEDQSVWPFLPSYPLQDVGTMEPVLRPSQGVEVHVATCPIEVGARHVHGGGRGGASVNGIDRGRTRVAKQVQKILTGSQVPDQPSGYPVVQEKTGVQIVRQVHQEPEPSLPDREEYLPAILPEVLGPSPLAAPDLQMDPVFRQAQDFTHLVEGRPETGGCAVRINAVGSLVLLDVNLFTVKVYGNVEFRDIRVVEPVTADVTGSTTRISLNSTLP